MPNLTTQIAYSPSEEKPLEGGLHPHAGVRSDRRKGGHCHFAMLGRLVGHALFRYAALRSYHFNAPPSDSSRTRSARQSNSVGFIASPVATCSGVR